MHKKQVQTAYLAVISYLIQPSYTNQAKSYAQGLLRHFDLRITLIMQQLSRVM